MGRKILIDTNICIGYIGGKFPKEILDKIDTLIRSGYHLSVINKIELLGFQQLTEKEEKLFRLLIDHALMYYLDDKIAEIAIEIKQNYRIKTPDAVIAATCLLFGLTLVTKNFSDFEKIAGLTVIQPDALQEFAS
jgi:predicted nucleic acid-binding protein